MDLDDSSRTSTVQCQGTRTDQNAKHIMIKNVNQCIYKYNLGGAPRAPKRVRAKIAHEYFRFKGAVHQVKKSDDDESFPKPASDLNFVQYAPSDGRVSINNMRKRAIEDTISSGFSTVARFSQSTKRFGFHAAMDRSVKGVSDIQKSWRRYLFIDFPVVYLNLRMSFVFYVAASSMKHDSVTSVVASSMKRDSVTSVTASSMKHETGADKPFPYALLFIRFRRSRFSVFRVLGWRVGLTII